jgi:acetyl esterase/lipase
MFLKLYYIVLSVFLLASLWVIFRPKDAFYKGTAKKRSSRMFSYAVLFVVTLFLLSYQILLWTVPKSTELHETLRLLPHSSKLIALDVDGMEETRYPFGSDARQYLILFQPKDGKISKDKIIYFVHGGAWRYGSPEMYKPVAKYFTERGYAVFITAYRLAPKFHYEHMREDLNLSFKRAMEVMKSKNWSKRKIILMGDSAGSNLAALLLYDRENLRKIGAKQAMFHSFISFVGALDIDQMHKTNAFKEFTKGYDAEILKQANPANYIQKGEKTPVLAFHGTADGYVDYECTEHFIKKLNQVEANLAQLLTIDDGTHISVGGEWLYKDNEVKQFLEDWLDKKEQQLEN